MSQLTRKDLSNQTKGWFQVHPYIGAAISSPDEHYKEISFKKIQEELSVKISPVVGLPWSSIIFSLL